MLSFFGWIESGSSSSHGSIGEWEDEEVEALCKEAELIHCVDPLKRHSVLHLTLPRGKEWQEKGLTFFDVR
jgi:hypothetical protein